jgi:CubicO group peptidase (beta-lactamase class C family)
MAILVDQGKLDWDTPVREYLPSFKLCDPFAAERATPRDLVTHRTGLPRHDLMWYHNLTATGIVITTSSILSGRSGMKT